MVDRLILSKTDALSVVCAHALTDPNPIVRAYCHALVDALDRGDGRQARAAAFAIPEYSTERELRSAVLFFFQLFRWH